MSFKVILNSIIIAFALGCQNDKSDTLNPVKWTTEQSIQLSETLLFEQEIDIKLYLKQRPDWKMKTTGSGLRYWIYDSIHGRFPEEGQTVDVNIEIKLLTDSLCFANEKGVPYTFIVDKSDVESGIQEGIKFIPEGGRAKFIFPSHLGHGLIGDLDKIPPLQVLVVDVHLLAIRS